jgi:two-component system phosphate regulon sensor histidine kinase PhoR
VHARHRARIAKLSALAEAIARGEFDRRADVEVGTLARSLHAMAGLLARAGTERAECLAILSNMSDGVIATDRSQRVVVCNRAAVELLDISEPGKDRPLYEVIRHPEILKAEKKSLVLGPIRGRHLEVAVSPHAGGVVIVIHDVTQSVRYQELRKDFVANVSHELRTPLTFILGFVETLQDGAMSDPVKGPEYLATIEKHVRQLTNLVSDLLELSRLEGQPGVKRVPVDVAATAQRVVEQMRAAAKEGQTLSVEAAPYSMPADPDQMERAIANLVENAIKYTPEGGAIRVRVAPGRIEVEDNGIGIPAEDLPRVFERFYRVDKSRSREMGGTGLGLAIVKHIAQAHGGTVEAESEVGKGSTFRIRLP